LDAIGLLGGGHGEPAVRALGHIRLLLEPQDVGIEVERLFLIVHVDARHLELHGAFLRLGWWGWLIDSNLPRQTAGGFLIRDRLSIWPIVHLRNLQTRDW